jgi:hypothetical protein
MIAVYDEIYPEGREDGLITQCSIQGLTVPHAHKNTDVQFMSRDDHVIMHKIEDCETDHIDNKHHLCGLRASISVLYWSEY